MAGFLIRATHFVRVARRAGGLEIWSAASIAALVVCLLFFAPTGQKEEKPSKAASFAALQIRHHRRTCLFLRKTMPLSKPANGQLQTDPVSGG
jgi:hypothetical protein